MADSRFTERASLPFTSSDTRAAKQVAADATEHGKFSRADLSTGYSVPKGDMKMSDTPRTEEAALALANPATETEGGNTGPLIVPRGITTGSAVNETLEIHPHQLCIDACSSGRADEGWKFSSQAKTSLHSCA